MSKISEMFIALSTNTEKFKEAIEDVSGQVDGFLLDMKNLRAIRELKNLIIKSDYLRIKQQYIPKARHQYVQDGLMPKFTIVDKLHDCKEA
jgi:GTP:adenosylcobinamide-phosphate guanylyltransferase